MFNRPHIAMPAVILSLFIAATAHATGGDYQQNFASAPGNWTTVLGGWNAAAGEYSNTANTASPATISYYNGNDWATNYTYKVQAYSSWAANGNQVGLVFGLTSNTSYFAVLVNMNGDVTINQISGTVNTVLASGHVEPSEVGLAEDQYFPLDIFVNRHKDWDTGANSGHEVTVRVNGTVAIAKFAMPTVAGKLGVIARADLGRFKSVDVTDNLATRIFRGTFSGPTEDPPRVTFDQSSCTQTKSAPPPAEPLPADELNRWNCWGAIKGQDNSGDRWPFHLWGKDARLQFNSKSLDADVRSFVDASMVATTGHANNATTALYFQLKKIESEHHAPQILYNLQPADGVPQHALYMRFWMKIPSNSSLDWWHSPWQAKTQNDRIILKIENGSTGCPPSNTPHWTLASDNSGRGTATTNYWSRCSARAVPIDRWFKVEIFLQHRTDAGQQSRFWVTIDNDPTPLFNVTTDNGAGLFAPDSDLPINRLMVLQLYGGDIFPKYQYVDDFEVWDGFPSDASAH